MGLKKEWHITTLDGNQHTIHRKGSWAWIDGQKEKMGAKSWFVQLYDHELHVGGSTCHLVVIGRNCDLAVDGVFLGSQKPYTPIGAVPLYATVLSVISCVLGFILNKWLGLLIGAALGAAYCSFALQKRPTAAIITFILGSVFQIVFGFVIAILLFGILI